MSEDLKTTRWARFVRWAGFLLDVWPLLVCVHDRGVLIAWRGNIWREWHV